MNKNTIWWRLTPVAAWLTIASLIGLDVWRKSDWNPPFVVAVLLWIIVAAPILYLNAFVLWHWKYRYRGDHPVAWAVAFPILIFCVPALFYFILHVNLDRESKKQYAATGPTTPAVLPSRYNILRSVCFVVGGTMLGWASFAAVCTTITYGIFFDKLDRAVTCKAGKMLTSAEVQAFHASHEINTMLVGFICLTAICAALGGILLAVSQSIRWRLKEQEERKASDLLAMTDKQIK